ncbi:hypothetical protein [Filifactor villosus]|uniref:Uncharacterized protein n=1 Tax=Filifactor villosus TaxID=29374 RepID=A0ABV9QSQ3_9FIRM
MLEVVMELLLELIFEGSIEFIKTRNLPGFIRYPLIVLVTLLLILITLISMIIGFVIIKDHKVVGIVLLCSGVLLSIFAILKFRNKFKKRIDLKNK